MADHIMKGMDSKRVTTIRSDDVIEEGRVNHAQCFLTPVFEQRNLSGQHKVVLASHHLQACNCV